MPACHVTVGIIFLSQTVFGALGNSFLFLHYLVLDFTGGRVRHTDLIIKHLVVANLLTLLCKGVPQTMEAFGVKVFLSDIGCKLLFYLHRLGRGVSIGSICFLSVLQAIMISPGDATCSELKANIPKYVGSSIYLCWILYSHVNIIFLLCITEKMSSKNITSLKDFGYCTATQNDKTLNSILAALLTLPDALCVGLMLWASSSMVLTLHRHKQRMQHVQKTSSSRSSPESRATKTILLLVSTFVSFYTLSCIFQVILAAIYIPDWFVVNTAALFTGCFPAVSPFLLKSRDSSRMHSAWMQNRKGANHMRKI